MLNSFAPRRLLLSGCLTAFCHWGLPVNALAAPGGNYSADAKAPVVSEQDIRYPVNRAVIFGDSISDPGNLNALLKELSGEMLDSPAPAAIVTKPLTALIQRASVSDDIKSLLQKFTNGSAEILIKALKATDKVPVIPYKPYYNGRFSNGPNWSEWLGVVLNGVDVTNADQFINRAYGGGYALGLKDQLKIDFEHPVESLKHIEEILKFLIGGKLVPPGLDYLVDAYLAETPRPRDNSLYVLFYGANDYLTCQDEPGKTLAIDVVDSICANAEKLAQNFVENNKGIAHVALVNMPDITKTPRYSEADYIHRRPMIKGLVSQHNQGLENCQKKLSEQKEYEDRVKFQVVDLHSKMDEVLASLPADYVTNKACYTGHQFKRSAPERISLNSLNYLVDKIPATVCTTPDKFAFWDGDHPTRMLHGKITRSICEDLQNQFAVDCSRIPDDLSNPAQYPKTAFNP